MAHLAGVPGMSMRRTCLQCALVAVAALAACSSPAPGAGSTSTDDATAPGTVRAAGGASGIGVADAEVARWVDEERIPGAVLLVAREGRVVFDRAYGYAQLYRYDRGSYGAAAAGERRADAIRRLDAPIAMQVDTRFDLASVTKMMATTFAVMLLVDDARLDLDAPVRDYLPDFVDGDAPAAGTAPGGKERITIRQLLTHRSGLSQWQPIYYHAADPRGAYAFIRDFPLAWEPGAGRHYSDLGFMLLGIVIERISGESLADFVEARLYQPLGLRSTGFVTSLAGPGAPQGPADAGALPARIDPGSLAATSHGNPFEHRMVHDPNFGYRIEGDADAWSGWRRRTLIGEVNDGNAFHAFGGAAGHAGLFSTAADLGVLMQLLLDRGEYDGRRYLSAAVVDEFLSDTGDGQALGWLVADDLPAGSFYHTGFTGTYVAGIPAEDTVLVLLTNRQNVGVDAEGRYPDIGELQRVVATSVSGER